MASQPSIPKGTRDFTPAEMVKRNYIFQTIKEVFHLHGYLPIETPSMENIQTLTGKYGEEGDKLLFRILDSGDFLKDTNDEDLKAKNSRKITSSIASKGLRYDLTVPFARFVVMHRNELTFPFKRYQIQPVWRADRPQKGRYREFYQCDADVIGTRSLLCEAEMIQMIDDVFTRLNITTEILINNRKILSAIVRKTNMYEHFTAVTTALDKLDKIDIKQVTDEMIDAGITDSAANEIISLVTHPGTNEEKLNLLRSMLGDHPEGNEGIQELSDVLSYCTMLKTKVPINIMLNLARGLNYYTGIIIEVKPKNIQIGSICGGGRYDNLTGIFGMKDLSGIGISFGAERIFDIMDQLSLFPEKLDTSTQVLFVNFGKNEEKQCLQLLTLLHAAGISAEIYPDQTKMAKQLTYANDKNIPFVALIGEDELKNNSVTLKNMITGEQNLLPIADMIQYLAQKK